MNINPSIPLIIFAKAPIAGKVKTRLLDSCTAEQAAEIAKILLEQCVINALSAWPGSVQLSVGLDIRHPFLVYLSERYSIELAQQCSGDLGAKMQAAFDQFNYPAAILGADAPHVTDGDLVSTHQALSVGENVIGPSLDGGYYLIGLSESQPWLFEEMPWGTSSVFQATLDRARTEFNLLGSLEDVDEWADVLSAAKLLPALADYLMTEGLAKSL